MPKEESKSEQTICDIDLTLLKAYITEKCYGTSFDLKNFATPLDLGKYKLAEKLYFKLKRVKDIHVQMRILFIAYKLNEFLEDPTIYANLSTPLKTTLSNRKDFAEFMSASDVFGIEVCAEVEIDRLFDIVKKMYNNLPIPLELPAHVYTPSAIFFWRSESRLHKVIKSLYDKCHEYLGQKLTINRDAS